MPIASIGSVMDEFSEKYPALITVEQAAEIAQIPPATIHAWSSAGRLDEFKHRRGRRLLLIRDEFVRFLLGQD